MIDRCLFQCHSESTDWVNVDYLSGNIYIVRTCLACGLGRTIGNEDNSGYLPEYYGSNGKRFSSFIERIPLLFRHLRARRLTSIWPTPGRLLDIGCGRGVMLSILKDKGWAVMGVERDHQAAAYPLSKGLDIRVGEDLKSIGFTKDSFDVITLYHVLEHLSEPEVTLEEIKLITKEGALLVIEVPNHNSLQTKFSKGKSFHLDCPRHRFHFTKETLERILHAHGFYIISIETSSMEFGPYGMFQSILNLLGPPNLLYRALRSGIRIRPHVIPNLILQTLLSVILLPLSFLLELYAVLKGRGAVLRVSAKRI